MKKRKHGSVYIEDRNSHGEPAVSSFYVSSLHEEVHLKQALAERGIGVAARLKDADLFLACCRGAEWNEAEWASAVEHLRVRPRQRAWLVALQLTPAPLPPLLQTVRVIALHTHWKDGIDAIASECPNATSGSRISIGAKEFVGDDIVIVGDGTPGTYDLKIDGPMAVGKAKFGLFSKRLGDEQ
jgi:hypothetical protein